MELLVVAEVDDNPTADALCFLPSSSSSPSGAMVGTAGATHCFGATKYGADAIGWLKGLGGEMRPRPPLHPTYYAGSRTLCWVLLVRDPGKQDAAANIPREPRARRGAAARFLAPLSPSP